MSLDNAAIREIATTAVRFMKGAEDNTIRDRILFAMMKKRGRIKYNESGHDLRWAIKFDLPTARPYAGGNLTFEPADKWRQLIIDWVAYKATDMMSEEEYKKNSGQSAIVKRYSTALEDCVETLTNQLDTEIFNDGGTNTDRFSGLPTFMADDGNTVKESMVAAPSDTYCGRSTALAAEGGTWSTDISGSSRPGGAQIATDWPEGRGTPAYDYLSSRMLNWGSDAWTNNAGSWSSNGLACVRRALIWTQATAGRAAKPSLMLLPNAMYDDFLSANDSKFRINTPHKTADDLGFAGTGVNFDGLWVTTQFGMTANIGYMLNIEKMTLRILGSDRLWDTEGPVWDTRSQSYLFVAGGSGNFTFNPKYFAKFANYKDS